MLQDLERAMVDGEGRRMQKWTKNKQITITDIDYMITVLPMQHDRVRVEAENCNH